MKNIYFLLFLCIGLNTTAQIINIPDANLKAKLLEANNSNYIAKDINGNYMQIDINSNDEIEISEALLVYKLYLYDSGITSLLGVENFINLTELSCSGDSLTSFPNMDALINLTSFGCYTCNVSQMQEVERLTTLRGLSISGYSVTSVDLSRLTNLEIFHCRNCNLTCIDASSTLVNSLWCEGNPNLQYINVNNGVITPAFRMQQLSGPPPLPLFNFSENPNLIQICYDEGEYEAVTHGFIFDSVINPSIVFSSTCEGFDCVLLSNQDFMKSQVNIYPNPTTSILNIQSEIEINNIVVTNMLGQKLLSNSNQTTIDVSNLSKGTYFITIETDNRKQTQKFIKQ